MTSGKWFKLFCVAVYGSVVALIVLHVRERPAPDNKRPVPSYSDGPALSYKTTRFIHQYERIGAADISSTDLDAIIGHFATHNLKKGDNITAKDVSDIALVPAEKPTIAVALTIGHPPNGRNVTETVFQLCIDGKPAGKPTAPITAVCDGKTCIVTLPLEDQKELLADSLGKRLQLVFPGHECRGG